MMQGQLSAAKVGLLRFVLLLQLDYTKQQFNIPTTYRLPELFSKSVKKYPYLPIQNPAQISRDRCLSGLGDQPFYFTMLMSKGESMRLTSPASNEEWGHQPNKRLIVS